MNTVPPLFSVWSIPWSKNWPKKVNSELYGGESPVSVVTFGMNNVWCDGVQPAGMPGAAGVGGLVVPSAGTGSVVHGTAVALPPVWVRCGCPAAAMAAGLVLVWSSIRLLAVRTSESMTVPVLLLYDVDPRGPKLALVFGSASRKNGVVSRGKTWLDAPKKFGIKVPAKGPEGCPGAATPVAALRLLQEPSTVRRPYDVITSGTCSLSGMSSPGWASRVPHGFDAVSVVVCRSAILICLRMNARSPGVTTKPLPTGAGAAAACCSMPSWSPSPSVIASAQSAANGRDLAAPRLRGPEPRDFLVIPRPT